MSSRIKFVLAAAIMLMGARHAAAAAACGDARDATQTPNALASIDLATSLGANSVAAKWSFHDVDIVKTQFPAAGEDQQPSGSPASTFDFEPHAGGPRFDYSSWEEIAPESLSQRRGHGRLSFVWYHLHLKVPARIASVDAKSTSLCFAARLDDYAEIWVDGELAHPFGSSGGSVVAGWNAINHVLLTPHARPGQEIDIAIFGMNGPISAAPTNYIFVRDARLEAYPELPTPAAVEAQEVNVEVERNDPAIDSIVPRNAKLFKLAEGFEFTEGPVWSRSGNYLLFSDPNHNTIYRYDEAGTLSIFKNKSGYDAPDIGEYLQPGSNGLTLDRQGRLIIDEQGRHRVIRMELDGKQTVLADSFRGKRLNSPNDLVVKSDGAVYFTDPPFWLPKFFDDPRKQLPFSGVYRWKNGRIDLITQDFSGPNGLAFSPDEEYLYLDNWDSKKKWINRYRVKADGTLGKGELFVDLTASVPGEEALDGMKVDRNGNLYVSTAGDIWIFNPAARHLGTIRAPKLVHNFAWGGADGKTLYLAASSTLYRMPLLVEGMRP